jgi:serine/threonine-protein kinase SRPK3
MGFEILGRNLLHLIKKYQQRGIPIPLVREIIRQVLIALDYMHRICKLIHTDVKPENIVFAVSQEEEFDLLYRHVFCSPLIKIYDADTTGSSAVTAEKLTRKQLKNLKKKEKKKKKKRAAAAEDAGESDDEE